MSDTGQALPGHVDVGGYRIDRRLIEAIGEAVTKRMQDQRRKDEE